MKHTFRKLLLLGLASASCAIAQIVSFKNDNPDTNNWTPSAGQFPLNFLGSSPTGIALYADSNLQTASLAIGPGATVGTATDSIGFGSAGDASTLAGALSGNEYFSFSLAPKTGYSIDVTSLSFAAEASSNTSTFIFSLFGSLTGFSAGNVLGTFSVVNGAENQPTVNLSSFSEYRSISSSMEFRIYVHRTAGTGTAAYFADDFAGTNNLFAINGSVSPVPEPSSFAALMGIAVLGAASLRRRNR